MADSSAPIALGLAGIGGIVILSGIQGISIGEIIKGEFGNTPEASFGKNLTGGGELAGITGSTEAPGQGTAFRPGTVSRTDAGKDFSNVKGPIGAVAPGSIASVHSYSGFGTTVFEKLDQPIAGRNYIYYALETGGRLLNPQGHLQAGTPVAQGTGGVIEVGLSKTPDVSGIEQTGAEGHKTKMGEIFAKYLGL